MSNVLNIIKDCQLTYEQKVISLAKEAENSIDVLDISEKVQQYREEGIICDLFEGNAPYRPRYIVPDYEKFMKTGSEFLKLDPSTNIWEATNSLLILYKHVPSITSFPVYVGNIDKLLQPFIKDEEEAYMAIKLFLLHIDRTITDSFCHGNIGPEESLAGRLILKAQRELQVPTPNLTLKYSKELTSQDFAIECINTALVTAKPSFANHEMFKGEFGEDYAIASCYNGLKIAGGAHTLVRLNFGKLVEKAKDIEHLVEELLPEVVKEMCGYMDERIRFLVEESNFFESNFLVKEELIYKENFTGMFGMVGLGDCVNKLLNATELKDRFGHSEKAILLGERIMEKLDMEVKAHNNKYCTFSNGNFLLHAQVGVDTDNGIAPGCRVPIGDELEIQDELLVCARFHKYFPSGSGDLFNFDTTVKNNPQYVLDIINGALGAGVRYFSPYASDSDVIRITGYLVKKSEMEKKDRGEAVLRDTTVLGLGAAKNQKILERKIRK